MTKEEKEKILSDISAARIGHMKWKNYLEAGVRDISSFKINIDEIQPIATECEFGKWYFDADATLGKYNIYTELGKVHEKIHEKYFKIVNLINKNNKSFFESQSSYMSKKQFLVDDVMLDINNYSKILGGLLTQLRIAVNKSNS